MPRLSFATEMSKRRTAAPQRSRASEAALQRRVGSASSGGASGRWVIWGLVGFIVLGLGAAGVAVLLSSSGVKAQTYADAGRTHITEGTPGSGYTSNPPTSGPHWPTPGDWGVYTTPMPAERSIHNLEHGGMVIWYEASKISDADLATLTTFTQEQNRGDRFKVHPVALGRDRFRPHHRGRRLALAAVPGHCRYRGDHRVHGHQLRPGAGTERRTGSARLTVAMASGVGHHRRGRLAQRQSK